MPRTPTINQSGYDRLWGWFGLSYASWLTIPRVLMHEMPDEWQGKMADLLQEADEYFENAPELNTTVLMKKNGKFIKPPGWLAYRHPDKAVLATFKRGAS